MQVDDAVMGVEPSSPASISMAPNNFSQEALALFFSVCHR